MVKAGYKITLVRVDDGEKGDTGDTGIGVSAVVEEYYLSTSNTTQTGGSWAETDPGWSSGHYIWTRSKVTWTDGTTTYTSPVLAKAVNTANERVTTLDNSLTQQEIFNRLTNNGQTQGIYLSNGKLYINADYIKTGTLDGVVLQQSGGGVTGWTATIKIHDGLIEFLNSSGGSLSKIGVYDGGLTIMSDAYVSGNLDVTNYLWVHNDTRLYGDLRVDGGAALKSTLSVSSTSTFSGTITASAGIDIRNTKSGLYLNYLHDNSTYSQLVHFRINKQTVTTPRLEFSLNNSYWYTVAWTH